jgi:hypothetical protein
MVQKPYWETNVHYSSTENICFLWHLKFHSCVHTYPSWLSILNQTKPQPKPPQNYFLKICNLQSAHKSPKLSFFQVFCSNLCMHFLFSHVCYMTYPHQSCWIDHPPTQNTSLLSWVQPCIKNSPDGLCNETQAYLWFDLIYFVSVDHCTWYRTSQNWILAN